jgi:hypothetical protein
MITLLVFLVTTHFYIFVLDKDGLFAKRKNKTIEKAKKLWIDYSKIKEEYNKNDEDGVNIILKTADFFRESFLSNISEGYYKEIFLPALTTSQNNQKEFEKFLTDFQEIGKQLKLYQFHLPKIIIKISSGILISTTFLFAFCFETEFLIVKFVCEKLTFDKLNIVVEILSILSILLVLIEILYFKKAIKTLGKFHNSQKEVLDEAIKKFATLRQNAENLKTKKTQLKTLLDLNL